MIECSRLSRRRFLVQVSQLAVVVTLGDLHPRASCAAMNGRSSPWSNWVTLGTDGTVTLVTSQSEMGQGIMTALPLLIAEEMDADWNKVRVVQSPADVKRYGHPGFGGALQLTGASRSTSAFYQPMRLVGAQTRQILLAMAAATLRVPRAELTTEPNKVVHRASGRTLTYGALAATASLPHPLPQVSGTDLKSPQQWRYVGKKVPRIDIPAKVVGAARFGIDVEVPGMLHASIVRAPVQGETPRAMDASRAEKVPGVLRIVRLPHGVGVIAQTQWAARQARETLQVSWTHESPARRYSSQEVLAEYRGIAEDFTRTGVDIVKRGDVAKAFGQAHRTLTATYLSDHIHHATMEPMNATARVRPGEVEIWAPTQAQTATQTMAAELLGLSADKVTVNTTLLGGGFGRRSEVDYARDAVLLARSMEGHAVKVLWTREDDVQHGFYRPLEAQALRVALDPAGQIAGWRHRLVADSIFARYLPAAFEAAHGADEPVTMGMECNYRIANFHGEYIRENRGVDVGFWRGVGAGYTKFAIECMLDEICAATAKDPLQTRLRLLDTQPRAQHVLRRVAELASWGSQRTHTGLGLAYSDAFESHCAQVAEIEVDRHTGALRVHTIWCVIDAGIAIQPDNIEAQMMSAITQGVSQALYEQINFVNGGVQESNFHNYRVLRMSEAPAIHVEVVASSAHPGGVGETGLPPVGAAIANAFAAATRGARLRHYPFLPERVKAALKSPPPYASAGGYRK